MDSVRTKVNALEKSLGDAQNARNVDAMAAFYAPDAQSLANNEKTRVGIEAIKAGIKRDLATDSLGNTISYTTTQFWAGGNYVTETGVSTAMKPVKSCIQESI